MSPQLQSRRSRRQSRPANARLRFETLESRHLLATLSITKTPTVTIVGDAHKTVESGAPGSNAITYDVELLAADGPLDRFPPADPYWGTTAGSFHVNNDLEVTLLPDDPSEIGGKADVQLVVEFSSVGGTGAKVNGGKTEISYDIRYGLNTASQSLFSGAETPKTYFESPTDLLAEVLVNEFTTIDLEMTVGESIIVEVNVTGDAQAWQGTYTNFSRGYVAANIGVAATIKPVDVVAVTDDREQFGGLQYQIIGKLPESPRLGLYWSENATYEQGADPEAVPSIVVANQANAKGETTTAAFNDVLTGWEPRYTYVLFVADPVNAIAESDEENNVQAFEVLAAPEIQVEVFPQQPLKGGATGANPYTLELTMTNNSLIWDGFNIMVTADTNPTGMLLPTNYMHSPAGPQVTFLQLAGLNPYDSFDSSIVAEPIIEAEDSWNWISPDSPVLADLFKNTAQNGLVFLISELSKIVNKPWAVIGASISQIADLALDVDEIVSAYDFSASRRYKAHNLEYTVDIASNNGTPVPAPIRVPVEVQVDQVRQAAADIFGMQWALGKGHLEAAFAVGINSLAAIPLLRTMTTELIDARGNYLKALDPPDPNFEELVVPQFADPGTIPGAAEDVVRHLAVARLEQSAYEAAEKVSIDRADGARLAGATEWEERQLAEASRFASLGALAQTRVIALEGLLASSNNEAGITQEDIDSLASEGFPEEIVTIFTDAGFGEGEIDALREAIIEAGPVATEQRDQLAVLSRAASVLTMTNSIELLKDAIELRVTSLGEEVKEVSNERVDSFQARLSQIEDAIFASRLSAKLFEEVEALINDIRQEILTTNNLSALEPYLQRAYFQLAGIQSFDFSAVGLERKIADLVSSGELSEAVAGPLFDSVNELGTSLEQGMFGAATLILSDFDGHIRSEWGQAIPFDTALQLDNYSTFVEDMLLFGELQPAPSAITDYFYVQPNIEIEINPLLNDSYAAGEEPRFVAVSDSQTGQVVIDNQGTPEDLSDDRVRYTSNSDFTGLDEFDYAIVAGRHTAVATTKLLQHVLFDETMQLDLPAGETRFLAFSAASGQSIFFHELHDSALVDIGLINPEGELVDGFTPGKPLELVQDGYYLLRFDSLLNSTAALSFRLINLDDVPAITLGEVVSGTLPAPPGDGADATATFFRFATSDEDRFLFQSILASPGDGSRWQVVGPTESTVPFPHTPLNEDFLFGVQEAGTYYLLLTNTGGTEVDFEFLADYPAASVESIALGEVVTGQLTSLGETAVFRFEGVAQQRVYFDALIEPVFENVRWRLRRPNGDLIQSESPQLYELTDYDSERIIALPEDGEYQLEIDAIDDVGEFAFRLLNVELQPTLPLDESTIITLNAGPVSIGYETQLIRIPATIAGQLLLISEAAAGPDIADSYWAIFDPTGDWTTDAPLAESIVAELAGDGEYVIAVVSDVATTVELTFKVTDNPTLLTSAIAIGETVSGNLSRPLERHIYTFEPTSGDWLYFDTHGNDVSDRETLYVSVRSPSGRLLMFATADEDEPFVIQESGQHEIVLQMQSETGFGEYQFQIANLSTTVTTLELDSVFNGELIAPGSFAAFRMSASDGDRFVVESTDLTNPEILWTFYGSNGSRLSRKQSADQPLIPTVPEGGDVFLLLENTTSTTATYQFIVKRASDTMSSIVFGETVEGLIDTVGAKHQYTFQATVGQWLFLDVLDFDDEDIFGTIQMTDGEQLFGGFKLNYDIGPLRIRDSGEFIFEVFGFDGAQGDYSFELVDLTEAPLIEIGAPVSGVVGSAIGPNTPGNDLEFFRIELQPNQTVVLDSALPSDGTPEGEWSVYDLSLGFVDFAPLNEDLTLTTEDDATQFVIVLSGFDPFIDSPKDLFFEFVARLPASGAIPLTLNDAISGNLQEFGEMNIYTFNGVAGQRVFYDALYLSEPFGSTANVSFVTPSQFVYFEDRADTDIGPLVLPEDGQYSIMIDSNGVDVDYTFRLLDLENLTRLNSPQIFQGILADFEDELIVFEGEAGQSVKIDDLGGSDTRGDVLFFDPDNRLAFIQPLGISGNFELEKTGLYIVWIAPHEFEPPVEYNLRIRVADDAVLPGDANNDGIVDLADFNLLKAHFGLVGASREQGDLNGDAVVDLVDFNVLKENFGSMAAVDDLRALDTAQLPTSADDGHAALDLALALLALDDTDDQDGTPLSLDGAS